KINNMESFEHFVCIHPYITIFIAFFIAIFIGGGMASEEYAKKLRNKEEELNKYHGIENEIEEIEFALDDKDIESAKDSLETLKSRLNL
ncbi:TPA: hypothetical protein U0E97_001391, partial [Legionella pneumophila]|nr:hypothetical protein [Legionella pneumophila]